MSDNEELIESYRDTLRELRKRHERMRATHADKKTLAQMISSLDYSLFWLVNGYERPPLDISPTKQSKDKREELWGEIQHADSIVKGVYDTYVWEESEKDKLTDKQLSRLVDVSAIIKTFSNQELNAFILKHSTLLETSEIAKELGVTEKAISRTLERITGKVNGYFNHQINIDIFPGIGW